MKFRFIELYKLFAQLNTLHVFTSMETTQLETRTTRSGQVYGRTTEASPAPQAEGSREESQVNPITDDGEDEEYEEDDQSNPQLKYYSRKCKLSTVLLADENHHQIYKVCTKTRIYCQIHVYMLRQFLYNIGLHAPDFKKLFVYPF